jgi:ABC-type amino acid transport substrate-binding protein
VIYANHTSTDQVAGFGGGLKRSIGRKIMASEFKKLFAALTPLRAGAVLRTFRGPLVTAFATGNLLIVLPILAADSKTLLGETSRSGEPTEQEESSVDILIPAAFPFPTLGAILGLMFVLFGGWYVGTAVPVTQYPTLVGAGLATLFGGTVLALPFLFDLLRLPADLFQVFVTVDVIGSRFGTLLAAMHLMAIALIGTYALRGTARVRPLPLLRWAAVSVALTAVALVGTRAFYTWVYVVPYTKNQLLASMHLIAQPQPHTVYREPPAEVLGEGKGPLPLTVIKQRGVLRVCYARDDYPSAFFNDAGELVGFDVEMAHRFARELGLALEFLPVGSASDAKERVNSSYCDVLMSLIAIEPERTDWFGMTAPALNEPVGMIVKDYFRDRFREIRKLTRLKVAVVDDRAALDLLRQTLPNATPVPYKEKRDLEHILATGAPGVDAVGMFAEQAAAWTIRYPEFSFVPPTPPILIPSGYAVARGNTDLLLYLDTWLLNAKLNGTIDELYRYWMLGQIAATQPPRWSVIRNVLGWVH